MTLDKKRRIFWKDGMDSFYNGVPAKDVVTELEKINSDSITPEQIVNVARDENSLLHQFFEWNDSIAAEKYRKIQAQQMLCRITYIVEDNDEPKRYYHNFTYSTNEYHPIEYIFTHKDSQDLLIKRAYDYLEGAKKRFSDVQELNPVWEAIDIALKNRV